MKHVQLLMLLVIVAELPCWQIFHRGRLSGGNLGVPGEKADDSFYGDSQVTISWFTQNLDHFNFNDNRTWNQRYFVNEQYYNSKEGGPVFLKIGGESKAVSDWLKRGIVIDNAKKYGALCFELEHRYYGESHPTDDVSTDNLEYLTIQQALADLAEFISAMNEAYKLPIRTKWIAFGGSYSGSLAAWLRLKYPHLVYGAVSSSSVLLAQPEYRDYYKIVADSLESYSRECVQNVQIGMAEIETLLYNNTGVSYLNIQFDFCKSIQDCVTNPKDLSNLYDVLAGHIATIVQYNNFISDGNSKITINTICDIMTDESKGTPTERLSQVNNLISSSYGHHCISYKYDAFIKYMKDSSWYNAAVTNGDRQWVYQTCTELGLHQSSSHSPHIFSNHFPLEFYYQSCVDIFGSKYNSQFANLAARKIHTLYGAFDIDVTNVVFVYGSIDPWHAAGITKSVNPLSTVIYIKGTAHCADMYPELDDDPPQLKDARKQITEYIGRWLLH